MKGGRLVMTRVKEPKTTDAVPGEAAACAAGPSGRRRAGLVIAAAVGLLACAAYALGWVGETGALFVFIGLVVAAKTAFGGFG
jgi:hypothetical protein